MICSAGQCIPATDTYPTDCCTGSGGVGPELHSLISKCARAPAAPAPGIQRAPCMAAGQEMCAGVTVTCPAGATPTCIDYQWDSMNVGWWS